MKQLFKNTMIIALLPTAVLSFTACTATNSGVYNEGDNRRVDRVTWTNQADMDINAMLATAVDSDKTRLVFIRKSDDDAEQTSANIAVNNRFQVSLHPGSYSVVESCVGTNNLSAQATGFKNNNLSANSETYQLQGGQTYFIYVDMDEQGNSSLTQVTDNSALQLLENKRYQTHQVSRVVPNCPPPVVVRAPIVVPPPVVIEREVPVLAEPATIDLEVLFDTDKSVVKPEYFSEVAEVADFMNEYSNTTTVLEGHTDSRASDSYNQALSQRRVDAVSNVLTNQFGIMPNRVTAIGYGESRPRASNDTAEGRQLNRRVVAVVEERPSN
ncbi:OmpA family protein [Psychrobacter jeotgali]|uniref:OmpA family protein n=1 Tax=Psychrobacter jeotgali TaxID=179010 RepID=UPI0019195E47|nr:OmpA family protein [Psychrobacter jeotgali]